MKTVVVGLSGGVDSSVAAHLLKEQGYNVIGLFMKNWHDDSVTISDECPWLDDSNDAMLVAEKLEIPFQTVDLSEEYKERIVDYMFREYELGRTPNPDVLCNREIKFDVFLKIALSLGADFVATGHYCRKSVTDSGSKSIEYRLLCGVDSAKDQSYFLCQLSQEQLAKTLFPIGELTKPEVRKIAQDLSLVTADKKDSQGLCFIGKVRLPDFLQQKLKVKKGKVVLISKTDKIYKKLNDYNDLSFDNLNFLSDPYNYSNVNGSVVGEHQGAHFYTIGQRKGLAIGGTKEPLFVIGTDVINNIVYVGEGKSHPGLYRKVLRVSNSNFHQIREDYTYKNDSFFDTRIRYRQPFQKSKIIFAENNVYFVFENPQSAITKGQFVAWYNNEELLGSGVID